MAIEEREPGGYFSVDGGLSDLVQHRSLTNVLPEGG